MRMAIHKVVYGDELWHKGKIAAVAKHGCNAQTCCDIPVLAPNDVTGTMILDGDTSKQPHESEMCPVCFPWLKEFNEGIYAFIGYELGGVSECRQCPYNAATQPRQAADWWRGFEWQRNQYELRLGRVSAIDPYGAVDPLGAIG